MGGFAGGDEAGYWDDDALVSSMDKADEKSLRRKPSISITDSIYTLKALTHTISLVPCRCETFTIEGCDTIPLESNSIYKAYLALMDFTDDSDISEFFLTHKVLVTKESSSPSGLEEGALEAAAFIFLVKEACSLVLSSDELTEIVNPIGANLAFYQS